MKGEDQLEVFEDQSYIIAYNPSVDGDCQFSAPSYFFQRIGVYRSANIIHQEIVQYLSQNPNNSEGEPLEYFAELPWSRYLHNMAQSGTYGNHITLQAASNLYNIKIETAFSLGHHACTMIQPQEYEPMTRFCLGRFAEGDGEHYVALDWYFVASRVSESNGGKETESPFNNDDTDDMLNDDDAVHADYPLSYNDAIDAGSHFNNDDTDVIKTTQLMAVIRSITTMQLMAVICSIRMMQFTPVICSVTMMRLTSV